MYAGITKKEVVCAIALYMIRTCEVAMRALPSD